MRSRDPIPAGAASGTDHASAASGQRANNEGHQVLSNLRIRSDHHDSVRLVVANECLKNLCCSMRKLRHQFPSPSIRCHPFCLGRTFQSKELKMLRVALSSFSDYATVVLRTMNEFGSEETWSQQSQVQS
mmetsp:Transcript_20056/g.55806  ORF Transcript_20056/g.55806 Transcript_20056/m.55806 type:complete len:130 (+) Transcript_20056:199-588(+)